MSSPAGRRGYLDWLRGVAVLIMVEAHVFDAWTRVEDRASIVYQWAMVLAGFAAPLFLFLVSPASRWRWRGPRARAGGACRLLAWRSSFVCSPG